MSDAVLSLRGVGKEYWLRRPALMALVDAFAGSWGARLARALGDPPLTALADISFSLKPGDVLGVIGRNGAGKSTLLRVIAGISEPSTGEISTRGKVASLLDLGATFHPDLTGRENALLAATLAGINAATARSELDRIIDFADLAEFINEPVRHYSSGMVVRLAFAAAIHSKPDVLLLDEVLAVGDIAFQAKCLHRLAELRTAGCAMIFVSHNLFQISQVCSEAMVLDHGRAIFRGTPNDAVQVLEERLLGTADPSALGEPRAETSEHAIAVHGFALRDRQGRACEVVEHGASLFVEFVLEPRAVLSHVVVVVGVTRSDGIIACNFNSALDGNADLEMRGPTRFRVALPPLPLVADTYNVGLFVWDSAYRVQYLARDLRRLRITHPFLRRHAGVFHQSAHWECTPL